MNYSNIFVIFAWWIQSLAATSGENSSTGFDYDGEIQSNKLLRSSFTRLSFDFEPVDSETMPPICQKYYCARDEKCTVYFGFPLCFNPTQFEEPDPRLNCPSGACRNGGTCIDGVCKCPPLVHGNNCETTFSPCVSNPCLTGETCVALPKGGHSCLTVCSLQRTGSQCMNGGTCIVNRQCVVEWSPFCERFRCECPPPFLQPVCAEPDPCFPDPCDGRGICVIMTSNTFKCYCYPKYFGLTCQYEHDPCLSNPCQNGGSCISTCRVGMDCTFRCNCSNGFKGLYCNIKGRSDMSMEIVSKPCLPNPCFGSQCMCVESCRHELGYYCLNRNGFIGKNCTIEPPQVVCYRSAIEVIIPEAFVLEHSKGKTSISMFVSPSVDADWKDYPACQVNQDVDNQYRVRLAFNSDVCGNTVTSVHGRTVYKNTVWMNTNGSLSPLFDLPLMLLEFNCSFDQTFSTVTSLKPVVDSVLPSISGTMKGDISVSLCKISTCYQRCPSDLVVRKGAMYAVAQRIHLSVTVSTPFVGPILHTEINEVYLSCSNNNDVHDKVVLLNGCTREMALGIEVKHATYLPNSACLSFKLPRMSNCMEFFIIIKAKLCTQDNFKTEACPTGDMYQYCGKRQETKRSTRNRMLEHVIGPIMFASGEQGIATFGYKSDDGESVVFASNNNFPLKHTVSNVHTEGDGFTFVFIICGIVVFFNSVVIFFLFQKNCRHK